MRKSYQRYDVMLSKYEMWNHDKNNIRRRLWFKRSKLSNWYSLTWKAILTRGGCERVYRYRKLLHIQDITDETIHALNIPLESNTYMSVKLAERKSTTTLKYEVGSAKRLIVNVASCSYSYNNMFSVTMRTDFNFFITYFYCSNKIHVWIAKLRK